MNLIFLFRRMVFVQVLLGIVAFCMAETNPGLMLVAGAIAGLSWYVTEGPSGRPLPRWTINLGALAATGWLAFDLGLTAQHVIIAMGHFTMALQILLLYTEKSNREYGQLMSLSLLQMVGASVLSVSMIYGILLGLYCAFALLTVLLFQLKITSDLVWEQNRAGAPRGRTVTRPRPVMGRGHRWHFRFMALVIGVICAGVGVAVFVVTPRSGEAQFGKDYKTPLSRQEAGFSQRVDLTTTASGPGNREPVLNVRVWRNGEAQSDDELPFLLLRGAALDRYHRAGKAWNRSSLANAGEKSLQIPPEGLLLANLPESEATMEAEITLRQIGHRNLFTIGLPTYVDSDSIGQVVVSPMDGQLSAGEASTGAIIYTVRWTDNPTIDVQAKYRELFPATTHRAHHASSGPPGREPGEYGLDRRPNRRVQGLAESILERAGIEPDPAKREGVRNRQIADAFVNYLQENCTYSLGNPPVGKDTDPLLTFLFKRREGHCELFAAAMTSLCRSVGLKARVVTGFRANEYNRIGGYFIVRQSNAHAWSEVDLGPDEGGWQTFDATPPDPVAAEHRVERGWLSSLQEIYEHMEYAWIRSVVAYDQRTRAAVLDDLNTSVKAVATDRESWTGQVVSFFRDLPQTWRLDKLSYTIAGVILVMIGVCVASLARTLVVRRRRMIALQLGSLPRSRRRGLARKLRFYLRMLELLERHGYVRPEWQSPFSFAQELADANPLRFDPVVMLTELFYEVRFGHRELDTDRKLRIRAHMKQLERAMADRS